MKSWMIWDVNRHTYKTTDGAIFNDDTVNRCFWIFDVCSDRVLLLLDWSVISEILLEKGAIHPSEEGTFVLTVATGCNILVAEWYCDTV